ncbi:MAG: hypothetical protein H0Z39_11205 [Peptococcaceae bacterium]|nr:hypothetical protein [Peptococcaceae bacterium]
MKGLWPLYKKEFQGMWIYFVSGPVVTVIWLAFLASRAAGWLTGSAWSPGTVLGWSFMLLFAIGLFTLLLGFHVLSHEWNNDTVYWLLSLPVRGYVIAGAKFLTIVSWTAVTLLPAFLGINWMSLWLLDFYIPAEYFIAGYFLTTGVMVGVALVAMLAEAIGLTVRRMRWFVTAASFVGGLYLHAKLSRLLEPVFSFLPTIPGLTGVSWTSERVSFSMTDMALALAEPVSGLVVSVLMFVAVGWLIDRRLEV